MKYNIIGDIHFRNNWKDLVSDEYVNIFIGDYFSPYISGYVTDEIFDIGRRNFLDIIKYKESHPETILLIGNHDEDHWHIHEMYSRFDEIHFRTICQLFNKYENYFNIAYSINNEVLVTHAGASIVWYMMYKYNKLINDPIDINDDYESETIEEAIDKTNKNYSNIIIERFYKPERCVYLWNNKKYWFNNNHWETFTVTPDEVSEFINDLWKSGNYKAFNFRSNAGPNDCYGDDTHHGPIWIRPAALQESNIFKYDDYAQVVGHTQNKFPYTYRDMASRIINNDSLYSDEEDKIFFCDCLAFTTSSVIYDTNSKKFSINNKK